MKLAVFMNSIKQMHIRNPNKYEVTYLPFLPQSTENSKHICQYGNCMTEVNVAKLQYAP